MMPLTAMPNAPGMPRRVSWVDATAPSRLTDTRTIPESLMEEATSG
jgi:hypothetical protein